MANLKNITDLPVAESAEGLNLIVNDNGAAKQIAASAVGAQADWTETDETSPAFIKNKPVDDLDITVNVTFNDDSPVFEASLNYGTFDMVKNKLLENEPVKIKSQIILTSPNDASLIGYENPVINCVSYMPQNIYGENSNPEAIGLLCNSLLVDAPLAYSILSDNTINVVFY